MKPVPMDRLDFSDHFSYIIYSILSYSLFSMNFRSFKHFLEFPELVLIQKMINDISIVSLLRQQVSRVDQGQTWLVGPACH